MDSAAPSQATPDTSPRPAFFEVHCVTSADASKTANVDRNISAIALTQSLRPRQSTLLHLPQHEIRHTVSRNPGTSLHQVSLDLHSAASSGRLKGRQSRSQHLSGYNNLAFTSTGKQSRQSSAASDLPHRLVGQSWTPPLLNKSSSTSARRFRHML